MKSSDAPTGLGRPIKTKLSNLIFALKLKTMLAVVSKPFVLKQVEESAVVRAYSKAIVLATTDPGEDELATAL
jgi:hypothetical protein